jgi:pyruvate formate lyase activating enzyme
MIKIGDIEKFSIVDWPNKIAAVVFMQGCPWRCPFCYNQSLQNLNGESDATWENLIHLLEHRKGIIDGVVFSGGEPLFQKNLANAMETVKNMGFAIGMHTGGYNPEAFNAVLPYLSWVGFDIKSPLEAERYKTATGGIADFEKVKESLSLLLDSGINFECRTTCDPRILNPEDIYKIADTLSALGVKEYYIQKYRPIESDKTTTDSDCEKFFTPEIEAYLKQKFAVYGLRK